MIAARVPKRCALGPEVRGFGATDAESGGLISPQGV